MGLFRRRKDNAPKVDIIADSVTITEAPKTTIPEPTIEIVANQEAQKEVIEKAKKASSELNQLLVQNGFTIKIYLAAGGKPPIKKSGAK
jgi:hypothetical protein